MKALLQELAALFEEAANHLEYTGYGDSWERECARADKLPERIQAMRARLLKEGLITEDDNDDEEDDEDIE